MTHGWDRVDEDTDAATGDTRIRVEVGEHDTFVLKREKYTLVEFPGPGEEGPERYDWMSAEEFLLRGTNEAKQVASMLSKADAFDPNILFFREGEPEPEEKE